MSADRLATSDHRPVDFPYPEAGRRSCPPVAFPACVSTHAPQRRRPAVSCAYLPTMSIDCPAASDRGGRRLPGPSSGGRLATAHPRSRSPCSTPPRFVTFGCATACYVDRSMASRRRPGTALGTGRRSPPSLRAPAGDPTPIMSVKGTYSGEIESLGNCDSRPGNAISRELTSLIITVLYQNRLNL